MTKIAILIVPEGESRPKGGIDIIVQHLPRVGDIIHLEDNLDYVGYYEVIEVKHRYNWRAHEKKWTDEDMEPDVYVRPIARAVDKWSKS